MAGRSADFPDRFESDQFEPLTAALARHAANPRLERPAFTYLDHRGRGDAVPESIGWAEVDRRARAVAARLAELSGPGERAAVLCPQNLDYVVGFLGALYAGMVAVPLFAPEVSAHGERLVGALADSDPEVWLVSGSAEPETDTVAGMLDRFPIPRPKQLLAVDRVESGAEFTPATVTESDVAYLQYTSGSTRRPAGAVITHGAVVANVRQAAHAFGATQDSTCVGWLPFFHDMGLVNLLCLPAMIGCPSVFTTPAAFIRKPQRWLKMLAEYPGVITAAPNFAYEYATAKVSEEDRAALDLSGVSVAINGSEPVRATTMAEFLTATEPYGFRPTALRPSYGLAEATVLVSTVPAGKPAEVVTLDRHRLGDGEAVRVPVDDPRAVSLVSAGKPVWQQVRIVDPAEGRELPDGSVGEIWLNGPNLATGYWRQPERSAETFGKTLTGAGEGWMRTGDLGVFLDGELYITGRLKDLIIIDGKNHYPQDIEETVQEAHPAIRRGRLAVFSVERDGHEGPVVVAEHNQHVPVGDDLERLVRTAVSRHHDLRLLDFVLVRPGTVPRTSSGKIARSATRNRYLAGELDGSAS